MVSFMYCRMKRVESSEVRSEEANASGGTCGGKSDVERVCMTLIKRIYIMNEMVADLFLMRC
jgi:hypothetical protein